MKREDQIKVGVDALDQGNLAEVEEADLDGYLERLVRSAGTRALVIL